MMLISYRGVVKKSGLVQLLDTTLPPGAQVLVVVQQSLSPEEQATRLQELTPAEWRKPFDAVRRAWEQVEPSEFTYEPLNDEALVALVHQVRDSDD